MGRLFSLAADGPLWIDKSAVSPSVDDMINNLPERVSAGSPKLPGRIAKEEDLP